MRPAVVIFNIPVPGEIRNEFIGIAYLASYLQHHGIPCDFFNLNYHEKPSSFLTGVLQKHRPQVVGLSLMGHELKTLDNTLGLIRSALPETHIVAGGHLASFTAPDLLKRFSGLDTVVLGEGEETFRALSSSVLENHFPDNTPNIVYRTKDGEIFCSERKNNIPAIDSLPLPSRKYAAEMAERNIPFSIVLSRGCTQSCTFCSVGAFYKTFGAGRRWRSRKTANVLSEIAQLPFGACRLVRFVDDDFFERNISPAALKEFTAMLAEQEITYEASMRIPVLTADVIKMFYESGLRSVYIGMESSNATVRRKWGKRFSNEKIYAVMDDITKSGIAIRFGFMMFHPAMSLNTYREDLDFLESILPYSIDYQDFVKTFFTALKAYPGTPIAAQLMRDNKLAGDPLQYGYYGYIMDDKRCADLYALSGILYKTYFKNLIGRLIPGRTALIIPRSEKYDFFCSALVRFFRKAAAFMEEPAEAAAVISDVMKNLIQFNTEAGKIPELDSDNAENLHQCEKALIAGFRKPRE